MHIVHDEHGNPVPHGHGECHTHEHCQVREGGSCPEHQHADGEHHHHHAEEPKTKEQMSALLDYMLKHNQSHAAELDKLCHTLADNGRADAAEQVRKAVDEFEKGNMYLGLALSMIRQ